MSTGAAGGVVISPSPSPSCLSAASSIDNLTTPLADITVGGATGTADGASGSDRKEGEGTSRAAYPCVCVCLFVVDVNWAETLLTPVCLRSAARHDHQPVPEERRAGTPAGHLPERTGELDVTCLTVGIQVSRLLERFWV